VQFGDGLRDEAGLHELAQKATEVLKEVLGSAGNFVVAEWERGEDSRVRPVLILRLSDEADSVHAVFDPEELTAPRDLRGRFYRAWADLLKLRSHRQLRALLASDNGQEGD
jgi:hypothetical protein